MIFSPMMEAAGGAAVFMTVIVGGWRTVSYLTNRTEARAKEAASVMVDKCVTTDDCGIMRDKSTEVVTKRIDHIDEILLGTGKVDEPGLVQVVRESHQMLIAVRKHQNNGGGHA